MPKKKAASRAKTTRTSVASTRSRAADCKQCDTSIHPVRKVTPLSKGLAMVLFIVLPFLAFAMGMSYQHSIDVSMCPEVGYIDAALTF